MRYITWLCELRFEKHSPVVLGSSTVVGLPLSSTEPSFERRLCSSYSQNDIFFLRIEVATVKSTNPRTRLPGWKALQVVWSGRRCNDSRALHPALVVTKAESHFAKCQCHIYSVLGYSHVARLQTHCLWFGLHLPHRLFNSSTYWLWKPSAQRTLLSS